VSFGIGLALVPNAGCSNNSDDSSTYFDRTISPILTTSCVNTNTNAQCHIADAKGNSLGNLDVATFDGINRRRDLLADYGPYGQPALLIKNVPPFTVQVQTFDGEKINITTDIKHAGGPILDPTASAYQVLRRWIQNGATANNTGAPPANLTRLPCTTTVPQGVAGFDPNNDSTNPNFPEFRDKVNSVLGGTCAASNCHGTQSNDLYLTCGTTPDQLRWNYYIASEYIAQVPEDSEIVRRPLAPAEGGSFHEGGIIFTSVDDPNYQAILTWAKDQGAPDFSNIDPNFAFFTHKVQPILVKKGCMMLQCHSSAQFHDYRLRGGSGGSFSYAATQHNYALSLAQLSLESADVNDSRIVQKNLYPVVQGSTGLRHRGGSLFEDFQNTGATSDAGTTPPPGDGGSGDAGGGGGGTYGITGTGIGNIDRGAICDAANYNYDSVADPDSGLGDTLDSIPAYCVIREWHRRERAARNLAPFSGIAYVKRSIPTGPNRPTDFDVYHAGADLHIVAATLDVNGNVTGLGADTSVTAGCGLDPTTADIRRPSVSWDGKLIAFAARASATDPLEIYQMNADGSSCAKIDAIDSGATSGNGLLIHNFDPVYSPQGDDGKMRIVFASTRGNTNNPGAYDYSGPQRTPSDPTKPNSDLYVLEPAPNGALTQIRQLTYQLEMEREPSFMSDGRIIFTAEKREQDFYELALRRMDVDGSDYHPLYSQRGTIGYYEATNVIELADKNFVTVFSNPGVPHGGGTLGVFNRSLGIDYTSTNASDYVIDPTVIDANSATSVEQLANNQSATPSFFLHSLTIPDPKATAVPGQPTNGLYTAPSMLPGGKILVSWGAATDPGTFGGDYDIYEFDPVAGTRSAVLIGGAGTAEVDAVGIFARNSRGIFDSTLDEPNSYNYIQAGHSEADILVLDMPVLATLLFQNTPTGRPIEPITSFDVYEELPPPLSMTDFSSGGANVVKDAFGQVYVARRLLGHVPIDGDGSAHFQVPGGLPFSIGLPDTQMSQQGKWPRLQREQMQFEPGEYSHQSFQRGFFNGLCANCHGAISGHQIDVAVQPDILSQASQVQARGQAPINLNLPPGSRGAVVGP
jgi:hypothetical protein